MIRYFLFSFILISPLFFLNSCSSSNKGGCAVEDFNPIFPKEIKELENYKFEANGQSSTESFSIVQAFPIPIHVEIIQVGCNDLTQELRLEIMDKIPPQIPAKECTRLVMGIFNYFSNLHPDLMTFGAFVQVMNSKLNQFEYNVAVPLQDGFSMQIDKMHNAASTLITVSIKQTKEN
jgi:hypothetical protein